MWRCGLLCLLVWPLWAAPDVVLKEPGFEQGYHPAETGAAAQKITGEIAGGWGDNSSWADVRVAYGRETSNPHGGSACQRIAVTRVAGGAVQFVQACPLKKGRVYQLRLWLRGQPGTSVTVMMRLMGAPYTTFAEQRVDLAAEWQEVTTFATMPADAEAFLMVRIDQPMTVWVDDAQLQDLTDAVSGAPAAVGNLLAGASFEAGWTNGWSVRYPYARADLAGVDEGDAADGRRALRCTMPRGQQIRIASPVVPVNFNRAHAASFMVRASEPGIWVHVQFQGTSVKLARMLNAGWQRITLAGNVGYRRWTRLEIIARNTTGQTRTLGLDAVMVEEAATPSPQYRPAAPMELLVSSDRVGHIVHSDETATAAVATAGPLPAGAKLALSLRDVHGRTTELPAVSLPVASVPLPAGQTQGLFQLTGTVVDSQGQPLSKPSALTFARLPRPRQVPAATSFCGIHVPLEPRYLALARAVGATWVRLHDSSKLGKWATAEPERDRWEFHDEDVANTRKAGLSILGMLDGAPGWTATKPRVGYWSWFNLPDKPDGKERWANYVRTVTGHYRGQIDHWEVWNEPWGEWWRGAGGTPQQFAVLQRLAYQEAKAANPQSTIVGIDTYTGQDENWTVPLLAAAGPEHFDIFSFHDYTDALYGGREPRPSSYESHYRQLQQAVGTPRPQWNTEGGVFQLGSFQAPETGGMSAATQLAWAVRYQVTYLAAGVSKFFFYAVHSDPEMGDSGCLITDWDLSPKPALAARAVLAWLVDGAGRPQRREPAPGADAYDFPPHEGRQVTVIWSYDGARHEVPVPAGVELLDVLGNRLPASAAVSVGPEPVYLVRR